MEKPDYTDAKIRDLIDTLGPDEDDLVAELFDVLALHPRQATFIAQIEARLAEEEDDHPALSRLLASI